MITANTKVTALEVLTELGIKNTDDIFGKMRVRIGGIAGINSGDRVINLPPEVKAVEVIVGDQLYELELAKGTKEDNADVATVSEGAKEIIEAKGVETDLWLCKLKLYRAYGIAPLMIFKGSASNPKLVETVYPLGLGGKENERNDSRDECHTDRKERQKSKTDKQKEKADTTGSMGSVD